MIRVFLLKILDKYASRWIVLCIDLVLISISFIISYSIRFDISFEFDFSNLYIQLPVVIFLAFCSFLLVGSYKGIIRHTGTKDAFNVFFGITIFSIALILLVIFNQLFDIYPQFNIPKSIIFIHYLFSIFVLVISRFIFKAFYEIISTDIKSITNVLIYGAGNSGMLTYGALNRDRTNKYEVFGFMDDNPSKINKKIDRIRIYNPSKVDHDFLDKNDIKEIIISIPSVKSNRLLEITDNLLKFDVKIKIVPQFSKWIEGDLQVNQIKQINIDDLLGREQISFDNPIVKRDVTNKVIIVTGAAGSIGSEISRQLASYKLEFLILIDQAESPLYDLQQELIHNGNDNFIAIIADVRDRKRMEEVFEQYNPQKVFHASAYKHVPLMEQNPYEAVKINVLGTKNIADLAVQFQVEDFVMISTDKAVNPTNVMGATKRVAELYISFLSKEKGNKTKFITTRFGNVLGSNGSVIPLFKKQIENGGPLTLTHKDITRYFMTIPEACRLVLEAGTMGEGGEIYIFDMGKSVKIFNMAKRMISLSGLKYPEDIDIKVTGLRPGEKLYEELLANDEETAKTYHEKIMIAKVADINYEITKTLIDLLCSENSGSTNIEIVKRIKQIVPEFKSNNSSFEKLD